MNAGKLLLLYKNAGRDSWKSGENTVIIENDQSGEEAQMEKQLVCSLKRTFEGHINVMEITVFWLYFAVQYPEADHAEDSLKYGKRVLIQIQ